MPGQGARVLTQKEEILRGNEVARFAGHEDLSGTWAQVSLPMGPGATGKPPGPSQDTSGSWRRGGQGERVVRVWNCRRR